LNRGEIDVLPPFLTFRMAWNRGINFGLLSHGSIWRAGALIAVALAISAWVSGGCGASGETLALISAGACWSAGRWAM
jgi:signal peptidase II